MTRKREVLAGEDISDLPPPSHRHPMSGEPIWDQHAVRAVLSKLRAPVADETQAPHDHDLWFQEYGQTLGAFYNNLTIHTRAAWVAASRQYAALAGAPVAEPETMEEIHRRERERAPWVLPKDPTLPASAPDTSEADASPIVPGGPYSDPEQFIASLGASAPVAGYIKPDPAAPTHPRYVSELKYRSAADAEADPEGKGWLKVYAAPQPSPVAGEAVAEMLVTNIGCKVTTLNAANYLPNGTYQLYAAPQASAEDVRELPDAEMRTLIGNYFADDWAKEAAAGLLHDYACALKTQADKDGGQQRACTCHPDDRPAGDCQKQYAATECQQRARDVERLRRIAWLIGCIFVHGNFKAETFNERELEKLLRENGTFWDSLEQFDAALSAAQAEQGERDAN